MVGLAYASVPLYRMFCQVTGFGGTTQRAEAAPDEDRRPRDDRPLRCQYRGKPALDFRAGAALAWRSRSARRTSPTTAPPTCPIEAITGSAVFNVTPDTAGAYFNKIQCFCFTEQTLKPGESVDMPVSFFVDPAIVDDHGLDKRDDDHAFLHILSGRRAGQCLVDRAETSTETN